MTAFGPYKDTEVIDFAQLQGHHLFVISGATGAGKTTIFDGICFALYGSASGSDRENISMLRSHFAADDVHTAVELVFELKGRTYRILRQLGHTKKGNKSRTGEKYEFFEVVDGVEVPCVDRQMVSEINDKLEQIIGLTQDQFKQIVMLPQGEFRKLLTSETENKEAILRRLFKTERYQQMNSLLKERRDEVEQQFKQESQMLEQYIKSIVSNFKRREDSELFILLDSEHYHATQITEALTTEAVYYEEKNNREIRHVANTNEQLQLKQQAFFTAKNINEQLDQLAHKKAKKQLLDDEQPHIKQKEITLEAAERAGQLIPYEEQVKSIRKDVEEVLKRKTETSQRFETAKKEQEHILKEYKQEEEKANEREKLKQEVIRLREFLPKVEKIDSTKQTMKKLHTEITEEKATLDKVRQAGTEASKQIQIINEATKNQADILEELQAKNQERERLLGQHKLITSYLQIEKQQKDKSILVEKAEHTYKEQKLIYAKLEASWIENQAVMLATHLHEGTPCPVCGSSAHPNKASTHESVVTRERLDEDKQLLDTLYQAYMDEVSTQRSYEAQRKEKQQILMDEAILNENLEQQLATILSKGKQLKIDITHLETQYQQMKQQKAQQQELEKRVEQLVEKNTALEQALQEKQTTYTTIKATFTERIREIPEDMQVLDNLNRSLIATEQQANKLEEIWQSVQARLKVVDATYTTEQANTKNINEQVWQTEVRLKEVEEVFQKKIVASNFTDEAAYQSAKQTAEAQQSLRATITTFKEEIVGLDKQIVELSDTLAGKQLVDLKALEDELQAYQDAYEAAVSQLNHTQQQYKAIKELQEKIERLNQKTEQLERRLATISDLYDVLRGQNESKVSFERYVQIDYLDQITAAANERFHGLSNGQFRLVRSDRQEAYGKQSGLAMDVSDAYTGQTRDVKTLSGGEKFIASLCLALGMSDVIQRFQGSISVDTMFIDEGFGSLDEESLYKAIDALIQIQESGRMIGVISHVEELKSIFPAMLAVEKTKEGFSKTTFVVK